MTEKVTENTKTFEVSVLDAISDTAFKFQFLTDDELVRLITKLINEGTDGASALMQFAKHHGGTLVAFRVLRLLRRHGPTGSGKHLWDRVIGDRLVLVEGSNA